MLITTFRNSHDCGRVRIGKSELLSRKRFRKFFPSIFFSAINVVGSKWNHRGKKRTREKWISFVRHLEKQFLYPFVKKSPVHASELSNLSREGGRLPFCIIRWARVESDLFADGFHLTNQHLQNSRGILLIAKSRREIVGFNVEMISRRQYC